MNKCPYKNPTPQQCFNCPFPDCVNDDLSLEEYKEDLVSIEIPKEVKMARIRRNRYAEKHREDNKARCLEHYHANKESYIQNAMEWQANNRNRVATAKRERWAKNPEYYRQKQREYRAKKKREKVG
jgi:hypothetical protein